MDSNGGNGKKDSQLSERDMECIKSVASYANDHIKHIKELKQEFGKMGTFRLFWDGKVPEKNKRIFNHVSLKSSDKSTVCDHIKKYLHFFENMETDMKKLKDDAQKSESEESDPLTIVYHLKSLLSDMEKYARCNLKTTDSSELHRVHSEFIEKFCLLDGMMNRIECIFSREKIKNLTECLDNCQTAILGAQSRLEESLNIKGIMEKQIEELLVENEKQRQHQQSQMALNAKLSEDHEKLLERYNNVSNRLESLEDLLFTLIEKKV